MRAQKNIGVGDPAGGLTVAGRYRLISLIATGGMGRVWRAHDELLDRTVAAKEVLAPAGLPDDDRTAAVQRTVREARAAARLDHHNIVRIFDVVRATGRSWIVMEYVPSRSLQDVVTRDGPMTHQDAARVGLTVLDALSAAHQAGVLHRDVKPHNVLIADDGRVVLTDFGLATIGVDRADRAEPLLGSPYFVAPERLSHGLSTEQADLWSLGATLYTAVEGRPPFSRPSVNESLSAVLAGIADPPQRPGPLHSIIDKLLVADPDSRLTAADARVALQDLTRRAVGIHAVPGPRRPLNDAVRFPSASAAVPQRPEDPPEPVAVAAPSPSRPRRWRALVVTGVAAAAVTSAGIPALIWAHHADPGAPPASLAATAPPVNACTGALPQPVSSTESGTEAPISLPEGWLWHVDNAGFALPIPRGWDRSTAGSTVCFSNPGDSRSFTVQTGGAVNGEPVQSWQNIEQSALQSGSLPGYQRISMGPLLINGGGADWEYTWQPATAPRLHTYRMLRAAGADRSYLLTWTTRDADWDLDRGNQRTFLAVSGTRHDRRQPGRCRNPPGNHRIT